MNGPRESVAEFTLRAVFSGVLLGLVFGAANAYLSLIPSMSADYHQVAARLAGDEAFHAAILANALGEPIPATPLMFGA